MSKFVGYCGWLLAASLVGPSSAQDPKEPESPPRAERTETKASVQTWIDQLGDPTFRQRRQAESELRKLGDAAKDALREASENASDAEVRWRAGRLLRQLEQGDAPLRRRSQGQPGSNRSQDDVSRPDVGSMFDSLFERLEREHGLDVPRGLFFEDEFFQDLERQLRDLRSMTGGSLPGGIQQGQALQMQIGPNGVKVQVQESAPDGKTETKTYEAPNVEAFRQQYPDIAERYLSGGRGGFHWRFGAPRVPFAQGPSIQPRSTDDDEGPAEVEDSGPRLGVHVQPIGEELREFLNLEPGQGLRVERVAEDSLAQQLDVREGDILLEVNGRPIASPEDVRAALGASDPQVKVRVQRRNEQIELQARAATETKNGVRSADQPIPR